MCTCRYYSEYVEKEIKTARKLHDTLNLFTSDIVFWNELLCVLVNGYPVAWRCTVTLHIPHEILKSDSVSSKIFYIIYENSGEPLN
jgi:hypothetical protein